MTRENLEKLKDVQDRITERKAEIAVKKLAYEKSISLEMGSIATLQAQESLFKNAIELEAVAEFKKTGKKKLMGGIGVQSKVDVKISYNDDKALEFAKEKGMFLQLDKKSFESALPSIGKLDWVTKTETPFEKVTFPTKGIILEDVEVFIGEKKCVPAPDNLKVELEDN